MNKSRFWLSAIAGFPIPWQRGLRQMRTKINTSDRDPVSAKLVAHAFGQGVEIFLGVKPSANT
jgi:hypothetical protein